MVRDQVEAAAVYVTVGGDSFSWTGRCGDGPVARLSGRGARAFRGACPSRREVVGEKNKPTWWSAWTALHHVGLLIDGPPGAAGLPFT